MSWGVNYVGKAAAVAKKLREPVSYTNPEPEETLRKQLLETAAQACDAMDPNALVSVSGNGHQSGNVGQNGINNAMSLKVEPFYGNFVE